MHVLRRSIETVGQSSLSQAVKKWPIVLKIAGCLRNIAVLVPVQTGCQASQMKLTVLMRRSLNPLSWLLIISGKSSPNMTWIVTGDDPD
jgi:hypothetical protein